MDSGDERRLLRFLERIADSLERLEVFCAGERPAPVAPKAEDLKDTVAAVRLRREPRLPDPHDGGDFPSSTVRSKEDFFKIEQ
jgi:hypothetical protein